MYEVNGIRHESWSAKNQRILDKFIDREVYCCMTSEVEYMLSKVWDGDDNNPFDEDDLDAMYTPCCSDCHSTYGFEEIPILELKDEDFETDGECFYCPVCGCLYATVDEAKECCAFEETVYKCQDCGKILSQEELENLDTAPVEVYEWWAVSRWFGEKLKEQGCVVIDSCGKSYWGREATGQSISLDGCIVNIAKDLQILDGMENEWSV